MKKTKSLIFAFIGILILLTVDFISKRLALEYLVRGMRINLIKGILGLHYVENTGAAFGVLSGKLLPIVLLTPLIVILVMCLYVKSIDKARLKAFRIFCLLFVAGSLGNFVDRVFYGFVVDFFEFQFVNFPVFNVADIYLTFSTLLMLALILFYYKEEDWDFIKREKKTLYDSKNQNNNCE